MNISDEMLSAFLDAALSEPDMERVRQQLVQDEQLTERLADLAMVDTIVQQYYSQIDQQPLPQQVLQLLNDTAPQDADIIQFPFWQRVQQQLQRHAAAVACIALLGGYGVAQLTGQPSLAVAALSPDVQQLLSRAPSGSSHNVAQHQLTPQLSFISVQGDFCRQYALQSAHEKTENIACRHQGEWTLKATLVTEPGMQDGMYQTASGGSAMDSVLDTLMAGPALNAADEQQYLIDLNN